MRHVCIALAALVLVGAAPVLAKAESTTRFRGLFEGVDPDDGSLTQRQITCDEDGLCRVLGSDSYFSFCPDSDGRGILEGEGRVEDGALVVQRFELRCADGTGITVGTRFIVDARSEALVEEPDDPAIPPITFHRIDVPLRTR